jgi:hypothetical protein
MAHNCGLTSSLRKFLVFHTYSFTPQYITRLLNDHGFAKISVLNSPPSEGDPHNLFPNTMLAVYVKKLTHLLAKCTEKISRGQLFVGTSLEVTAMKPENLRLG